MSLFLRQKVTELIYPKGHNKKKNTLNSSSKSTRAASKNIIQMDNKNFKNKEEYTDLYSDLLTDRQKFGKYIKQYPKDEEDETSTNSNFSNEKLIFKKVKKPFSQKKSKINTIKHYKEDGVAVDFPLYKERDLNINVYDKEVTIESGEDDFLSDEGTIDYGMKKVQKDLIAAFELIKKENCRCLDNLKRYSKLIDRDKRLNLKKKLPINK